MSAPPGPRARSSSRGRALSRTGLGLRGTGNGVRTAQPVQRTVIPGTRVEARGCRGTSPDATASEGRQTPARATTDNAFQQHLIRTPDQKQTRNKSWRIPSSLNAAFRSHAGKVASSRTASWRNPPFTDPQLYSQNMNDLYQTVCI